MASKEELRESVRRSFPELADIADETLREQVVEAWAFALSETEFTAIEQIRASGNPTTPAMKCGTQAEHLRGVARIALAMADSLEQVVGSVGIDRDLLCAAALCHDLGKPFEFSPANQARWRADPAKVGYPSVRHPAYGCTWRLRWVCRKPLCIRPARTPPRARMWSAAWRTRSCIWQTMRIGLS